MSTVFQRYAEIYDAIYENKEYASESAYVSEILGGLQGKKLLDVGCGTGRYSEIFATEADYVHGIDMSQEMVDIANLRKSRLRNGLDKKIYYEVGDARTFTSDKKFDIVCSMFHVINYQTTNEQLDMFFETSFNALNPEGLLIFDFWYGPGVLSEKPAPRTVEVKTESLEIVRNATPNLRINENCVDVTYDVKVKYLDSSEEATNFSETHSMRYLFTPELDFFSRDKFSIENVYAWRTRTDPSERDWSAVCVMRRL